jgi:predicted Zn finger-like uncharacterized protein
MSEPVERVAATCPACTPAFETAHEVLKPGGQATVRCGECGHVHKTRIAAPETVELDIVVSQDGESSTATTDAPVGESVAVGEEFVLDTPEALLTVRITGVEVGDEQRVESAPVGEVETLWTRVVGNVRVDVTLNPAEGASEETRAITVQVPGDYEFRVGESEDLGGERFEIKGIHLREDASGYGFPALDHEGDMAFAKDVARLYTDDESSSAWSAW